VVTDYFSCDPEHSTAGVRHGDRMPQPGHPLDVGIAVSDTDSLVVPDVEGRQDAVHRLLVFGSAGVVSVKG